MSIYQQRNDLIERIHKELEGVTIPTPHRVKTLRKCIEHLLHTGSNPNDIHEAIQAVTKLLKY
jgi:transposase-like protein